MEKTRTLIVASYAPVRAGLAALLHTQDSLCLQGEAPDADGSLSRLLPDLAPDAVLLDITQGGDRSLARVLDTVLAADDPPALVVLGDDPNRDLPALMGASSLPGFGYLLAEGAEGIQIAAALNAAASGHIVLDRVLRIAVQTPPINCIDSLTPRETEVLQLMAQGLPNKQIATRLGISLHTAKFHVAQILGKFSADSRTEAVTIGARRGFVVL
jgi:DNA-binding NarL/FixJ family response regulator